MVATKAMIAATLMTLSWVVIDCPSFLAEGAATTPWSARARAALCGAPSGRARSSLRRFFRPSGRLCRSQADLDPRVGERRPLLVAVRIDDPRQGDRLEVGQGEHTEHGGRGMPEVLAAPGVRAGGVLWGKNPDDHAKGV